MPGKKRVLIFIPTFPVLSATFIEREVSKLIEWGVLDVTVFSLSRGGSSTCERTLSKTVYKRINVQDCILATPFILAHLSRAFDAFVCICRNKNRNIIGNIFLFLKSLVYAKLFSQFKPDVLYCHFMSEPSTIGLMASIVMGVDFAVAGHARDVLEENNPNKTLNAELIDEKVSRCLFATVCNKFAHARLLEKCFAKDRPKVFLNYHGINFEEFESIPASLERPAVPVISNVGTRLAPKKGQEYLVEASKILKDRGIPHIIYFAGPDEGEYERLKKRVMELGVEDSVKILGDSKGLPFEEIASYFKISSIYAFPSVVLESGDTDGIATTLIEAAAFNVPVVATDAGSTTDLITDGETGLIVPQRDSLALANAIQRLLEDKNLANKLAINAYSKAREMFDIDRNTKKIQDLLV